MNLSRKQIEGVASAFTLDYAVFRAFMDVESGGAGFNTDGKIIIQFEPHWFSHYLTQFKIKHQIVKRKLNGKTFYTIVVDTAKVTSDTLGKHEATITNHTIVNGVEGQSAEWKAFNKAFAIHPKAAMLSTSIGMMQIMGFNYAACGYKSVDEMWDDFKTGELAQVRAGAEFIKSKKPLFNALKAKDFDKAAFYYNGANYKVNNYDVKLQQKYKFYLNS